MEKEWKEVTDISSGRPTHKTALGRDIRYIPRHRPPRTHQHRVHASFQRLDLSCCCRLFGKLSAPHRALVMETCPRRRHPIRPMAIGEIRIHRECFRHGLDHYRHVLLVLAHVGASHSAEYELGFLALWSHDDF